MKSDSRYTPQLCPKKMTLIFFRLLAILTLYAIFFGLKGCAAAGTPEQKAAARVERGKRIVALEQTGWRALDFIGQVAASVATTTAANMATQYLERNTGYRK